jgi:hypothetical protein
VKDKFFILLYAYKKRYGLDALSVMIEENKLDQVKRAAVRMIPCVTG